jgi:predicted permease
MKLTDDLRYAVRRLRSRPLFLLVAVATLSLGIGFNAVIFSLLNTYLLRSLPIREPDRVFSLGFGRDGSRPSTSYPDYSDIRDRNSVFSGVAAIRAIPASLGMRGQSSLTWGYLVSGNYFDLLGISAWRGRLLAPSDDVKSGAHPYMVLSYGCWQRRFGADPEAIGRTVKLDGHPFTIVGVAPPGFIGTERFYASEFWVTLSMLRELEGRDWRQQRGTHNIWGVARLKPGVSAAQAETFLKVLTGQMAREHPDLNEGLTVRLAPAGLVGNLLRKPFAGFGLGLMIVCGLTLVVACTNLSGLLLAHAADRRKELAIRFAMGADRTDIMRLMLMESLLVALAGGAAGLAVTYVLRNGIQALMPRLEVINTTILIDWRVAAFAFAVAVLTAFLFGLLPALTAARVDLAPALKNDAATGLLRGFHLRDLYVAMQVAISVVLLAGSVMMVRTLTSALTFRYGFDPDHAVAVGTELAMNGYSEQQGRIFQQRLIERVRALPGVDAAALVTSIPFSLNHSESAIYVEGRPELSLSRMPGAVIYISSPGYFRAIGTRLLAGRDFDDRDRADTTPVAVVNETFARKLFPGQDPLGKRFRVGGPRYYQIVGVVEAGKYQTITEDPQMAVWRAQAQNYDADTTVVARISRPSQDALAAIREIVHELDPDLAVIESQPLGEYMNLPLSPLRMATGLLVSMGGLGLLLSALGLYGLLAHSIVQRTREIAIRMALGARPPHVLATLLRRAAMICLASGVAGMMIAVLVTRLLGQLLYAEPGSAVYLPAAALLATVAAAACLAPARRALRVDPAAALRSE